VPKNQSPLRILVQTETFDIAAEHARINSEGLVGAVASFVGYVRADKLSTSQGSVQKLTLEHYPGMTQKALSRIAEDALNRWSLLGVTVIHRVGTLLPGDAIVLVLTASQHRQAAFDSCNFIMDYLKTEAPFWKKEHASGEGRWVDARDSDDAAKDKWR
jgi:molybdopterin synthase catalytic subunit